MINHPNRNTTKYPAERFMRTIDELKAATGLGTRILWEGKGPKDTGIAYHGCICLFDDGQPRGVVYLEVFKSDNGFEIFLAAPGNNKAAGYEWIKTCVTAKV